MVRESCAVRDADAEAELSWRVIQADVREGLAQIEPKSIASVVTSVPYWRQRDYQHPGQIGQEETPEEYVCTLVDVFRLMRPALLDDGCFWLNVGDKFAAGGMGGGGFASRRKNWRGTVGKTGYRNPPPGYKRKDLTGVADALKDGLRRDGWYHRQTVIWSKPVAVEPPRLDRPSTSHEYCYLFTMGERSRAHNPTASWWLKSVWEIGTDGDGSHVAQMPCELARRMIVCSSWEGDTILDPFAGNCTTGVVALRNHRSFIGIEIHPETMAQGRTRLVNDAPLWNVAAELSATTSAEGRG